MTSLILTIISIVLLSAISVVTINYLPTGTKEASEVAPVVRQSALRLERAFNLYAQAHANTPAAAIAGDADGGLWSNFAVYTGFAPAAVPGYQWVYGQASAGAPAGYANTFYFCMAPTTPGSLASQGKTIGQIRAQKYLSDEQAFVSPTCGISSNTTYSDYPAAASFTFFVKYVPGQL